MSKAIKNLYLRAVWSICAHLFLGLTLVLWVCVCSGCAPCSIEEFHQEGQARCYALVQELQQIENHAELVKKEIKLKKMFESLVDLMILVRQFQQAHPEDVMETEKVCLSIEASLALEKELKRIYSIEGGRAAMERAQQEALVRLDAFERAASHVKRKNGHRTFPFLSGTGKDRSAR